MCERGERPEIAVMDDLGYKNYCEVGQPIMTANKAAELYYKRADILDKGTFMINKISNNKYMFSHVDDYNNGNINATARPCIFRDNDTGDCMLGDDKPDTCDGVKTIVPTLLKDILNVGFNKKEFKKRILRFKEDLLLYLTIWYLNRVINKNDDDALGGIFTIEYTYKLVLVDKRTINSIRFPKLIAIDKTYEPVAKIYNAINKNMLVLPPDYIELVVNKLNNFIKGGNFNNCEMELNDVEKSSVYVLSMFRFYINEYKQKSKEFTGIVESMKTYNFLKDINTQLGGNRSGKMFEREQIECILNNNSQMFNIIMKNK